MSSANKIQLFHITPKINLPSILFKGLYRNNEHPGFVRKTNRYYGNIVFLTDNIQYIYDTQLTYDWVLDNEAIVLKIKNTIVEPYVIDWHDKPHRGKHEFVCKFVKPRNIEYYSNLKEVIE